MRNLLLLSLACGLCLTGCPKSRKSSPEYQKARVAWLDLLKEKRLSEAYLAPEVDDVLQLLERVDPASLDGKAAQALKEELQKGRAEASAAEQATEAEIARALQPTPPPPSTGPSPSTPPAAQPAAPAEPAPDAGATLGEPTPGMTEREFEERFGRCFEPVRDATIEGIPAKVWSLVDLSKCRANFPSFQSRSVVIANGKVESIRSNEALAPKRFRVVEGKLVPIDPNEPAPPPGTPTPVPAKP